MATIKRKKADLTRVFTEFGGLRDDADASECGAVAIRNLRFRSDKTLERRPGYRKVHSFGRPIRAFWQNTIGSYTGYFALSGQNILYFEGNSEPVSFGSVGTLTGAAEFFVYKDRLYLCDSSRIYVCNFAEERFSEACGYAPLLGVDWDPMSGTGEINEPINLYSRRLRIRYLCRQQTAQIILPFSAESIDSYRINGIANTAYAHNIDSRVISITNGVGIPAGAVIDVGMTLNAAFTPLRSAISSATIPYTFQKDSREYLYLTGGLAGYKAFSAAGVTSGMLAESALTYADSDPLYFKDSGVLIMGDTAHPLTAFTCQNNRVIAFGTSGAWAIHHANDGDTVEAYPLDSCPGCVSRSGVLSVGDELIVVSPTGLCSLKASSGDKDHFAVTLLSAEIAHILGNFPWRRAILFHDFAKNQIWLRDASDSLDGTVYLYDRALKLWTAYGHIFADSILSSTNGEILFSTSSDLYVFDESLFTDDGVPYEAFYQSGAISLGLPEEEKRSLRAFCELSPSRGQTVQFTLISDKNAASCNWEPEEERDFPQHYELRLAGSRFRYFHYILETTDPGPIRIHKLGFCCNL